MSTNNKYRVVRRKKSSLSRTSKYRILVTFTLYFVWIYPDDRTTNDGDTNDDLDYDYYNDIDDGDDDDVDNGLGGNGGGYMNYGQTDDYMRFTGDILGYAGLGGQRGDPQQRTWYAPAYYSTAPSALPGSSTYHSHGGGASGQWQHVEPMASSAERDEQRTRDLEGMFARGVRGLLTSYMQRALQPAIKETLMESLGYRLSYG